LAKWRLAFFQLQCSNDEILPIPGIHLSASDMLKK